jgi:putative endonuclease
VPSAESRQSFGKQGEDLAVKELQRRGYAILARRYRTRFGEIDIVAQDEATVVFVEVKARRSSRCGTAAEAVSRHKQRRIVAIDGIGNDGLEVRIIRNAFLAP